MQVIYARLTDEATWGTFQTGALSTAIWNPHLIENALTAEPEPGIEELTFYDGHNIPGIQYSTRAMFRGTIRFPLMPGMEGVLKYGFLPVSDVLPSFTLDFNDGIEVRRITGCRVTRGRFNCSSRQGDQTGFLEYAFTGNDSPATPPTFTEPAASAYIFGTPYNFDEVLGGLVVGGTSISNIASAEVICNNDLNPAFDEFSRISTLNYFGRTWEFNIDVRIKTNAERLAFQNQTLESFALTWTQPTPGTHSLSFAAGTTGIRTRRPNRPMRADQYQALTFRPLRDPTTGTDVVLTTT